MRWPLLNYFTVSWNSVISSLCYCLTIFYWNTLMTNLLCNLTIVLLWACYTKQHFPPKKYVKTRKNIADHFWIVQYEEFLRFNLFDSHSIFLRSSVLLTQKPFAKSTKHIFIANIWLARELRTEVHPMSLSIGAIKELNSHIVYI